MIKKCDHRTRMWETLQHWILEGDLKELQLLAAKGAEHWLCPHHVHTAVIRLGHTSTTEMVEYLFNEMHAQSNDTDDMRYAVFTSNLRVVECLHKTNAPYNTTIIPRIAAWAGNVEILKYIHANMVPLNNPLLLISNVRTCINIEAIKYLYEDVSQRTWSLAPAVLAATYRSFQSPGYCALLDYSLDNGAAIDLSTLLTDPHLQEWAQREIREALKRHAGRATQRAYRKAILVARFKRLLEEIRYRPGNAGAKEAKQHFEMLAKQIV